MAVISGRSLHDLAALSRLPEEIHLVGSHGTEFDVGFARALAPEALALRDRVTEELHAIAAHAAGRASSSTSRRARRCTTGRPPRRTPPQRWPPCAKARRCCPGVHAREGKQVIELAVVQADKGYALDALRHQVGATAAVFVGDDVTDEDAFSRLTGPDLGIKVGHGPTFATQRVDGPDDVARLLARPAREPPRLAGRRATPCRSSATRCSPTARPSRS